MKKSQNVSGHLLITKEKEFLNLSKIASLQDRIELFIQLYFWDLTVIIISLFNTFYNDFLRETIKIVDNFAIAQQKARKATVSSDLSSSGIEHYGARKRKRNSTFTQSSDNESSSDSDKRNTYPVLKNREDDY